MEGRIVLDKKAFKVLASDTRVGMLKSLARQRKTLTELAKEFGMSASTIKEHLDSLSGAELIMQIDDGHKWKYYELTRKGRDVLNPADQTKVMVLLSASGLAALATAADLARRAFEVPRVLRDGGLLKAPESLAESLPTAALPVAELPWFHIGILAVSLVVFALTLAYFLKKRQR